MSSIETKTDVFQFMSVRSPKSIEPQKLSAFYIKDDYISPTDELGIHESTTKKLREIFSMNGESQIGRILYELIFCKYNDTKSVNENNDDIISAVLQTLDFKSILCETGSDYPPESLINELEETPYIYNDYKYYLLPTQLKTINSELKIKKLLLAGKIIEKHTHTFNKNNLITSLLELFEVKTLTQVIYSTEAYMPNFQQIKNILFERLYTLYILRRVTSINLEEIIKGLQILHTLEFLAVDDFLEAVESSNIDPNEQYTTEIAKLFSNIFPELKDFPTNLQNTTFRFIKNSSALSDYFQSLPVIHPVVAKLGWYRKPFNDIKPIGIGDLKVVKQWLVGYKVGEISHIHNIMKGELKDRTHRHLEKTEEVFSFSSENSSDTQQENQTTGRFEVKRETENVIKTDINVGANANFTYKNDAYGITTSVGGNFAYANSNQDTQKNASNYAREVMDKAVTNIQSRSSQNRSITKIFETEETNKHSFDNTKGTSHTSGIYRWLDKKYKAQLFNYGKRLMFEFIIPEPAAFYVESKLRAAEFDIITPKKPPLPNYEKARVIKPGTENEIPDPSNPDIKGIDLISTDIDQAIFNQLRSKYDIGDLSYPDGSKTENILLPNPNGAATNPSQFNSDKGVNHNNDFSSETFTCLVSENNFKIKNCVVSGRIRFWDDGDANLRIGDNKLKVLIQDNIIIDEILPHIHAIGDAVIQSVNISKTISSDIKITNNIIKLQLDFNDLHWYELTFLLTIEKDGEDISTWQTKVYDKIKSIEQAKVDKINQEIEIRYNAKLADYDNALNELNAQVVNDIIQGRSEAFNRQTILEELKKHCLTMITKEFDADNTDDILSNEDALEDKTVNIEYEKFFAGEIVDSSMHTHVSYKTIAGFLDLTKDINYPKIKIDIAKKKARYIQFLEQAFEWQHLAYIFYPYFWAKESKWIKLMNRLDYTDNNMTAFLKAGSVRVLIAVTPAYNDAVMHFLATREPWEGGPLPVIGDPLFIPIHEEIRKQQDDLQNAVPEGKPWDFELPTSLVYLQDSSSPIPTDLTPPTT